MVSNDSAFGEHLLRAASAWEALKSAQQRLDNALRLSPGTKIHDPLAVLAADHVDMHMRENYLTAINMAIIPVASYARMMNLMAADVEKRKAGAMQ